MNENQEAIAQAVKSDRAFSEQMEAGLQPGAMVFQGTLLPAIGVLLTPWAPVKEVFAGVVITLIAAAWLRFLLERGPIRVWHLTINGGLYVGYLAITLA